MSQTLTISDDLDAHLEDTARRGLGIEDLLRAWQAIDQGDESGSSADAEVRRASGRVGLAGR